METIHIVRTFRGNDSAQENSIYLAGTESKGREDEDEGTMRHINHQADTLHAHRSRLRVTTMAMALTSRD